MLSNYLISLNQWILIWWNFFIIFWSSPKGCCGSLATAVASCDASCWPLPTPGICCWVSGPLATAVACCEESCVPLANAVNGCKSCWFLATALAGCDGSCGLLEAVACCEDSSWPLVLTLLDWFGDSCSLLEAVENGWFCELVFDVNCCWLIGVTVWDKLGLSLPLPRIWWAINQKFQLLWYSFSHFFC